MERMESMRRGLVIALVCSLMISCGSASEEIYFGEDQCAYCRMTISNPNYGALLITNKGRARKYDAIECMINDLQEIHQPYKKLKVVPYDRPKSLIPADKAYFVISEAYRSPMGANLAAFASPDVVSDSLMRWSGVIKKITSENEVVAPSY